jgi:hypothetical protein
VLARLAGKEKTMLEWRTRFWLRSYLRSSMWLVPLGAYVVSLATISFLAGIDNGLQWQWAWQLKVEIVQSLFGGLRIRPL